MSKEHFGKFDNGEEIHKFCILNNKVSLSVIEYGARIQSLKFCGKEMILGFASLEDYIKKGGSSGAVVGRYANRIENGRFTLGGRVYELSKNEGENTIHGGFFGLQKIKWDGKEEKDRIVMNCFSKDGEEGFPGNLSVKVVYSLYDDGIGIEYFVESDKDTPINITNHTYFNLSEDKGSIENHWITINANSFTPINKRLIPTGEIRKVKNTPFDFSKPKIIGKDINCNDEQLKLAGGYDHNYIINGNGFRKVAEVYSETSGITLTCYSDMPGVQFYSGNFLAEKDGKNGKVKRYGLCLETQNYPNSVNIPQFPSSIIKAGETHKSRTEYRFRYEL